LKMDKGQCTRRIEFAATARTVWNNQQFQSSAAACYVPFILSLG
jgi:hypothetical protein